jgi:hypothetical protein
MYMGFLGRAAVLPVGWISGMERPGLFVPPPFLLLLHVASSSFGSYLSGKVLLLRLGDRERLVFCAQIVDRVAFEALRRANNELGGVYAFGTLAFAAPFAAVGAPRTVAACRRLRSGG